MSISCLKISTYKIYIKAELQKNSVNFFNDTIMTKSAFVTVHSKPQGFGRVSSSDWILMRVHAQMPRNKFLPNFSNGGIGLLVLFQLLLELLVPETKMPGFIVHLVAVCVGYPDPYVFGSPGSASGSVSHKYGSGSGSFHHQAKLVSKT